MSGRDNEAEMEDPNARWILPLNKYQRDNLLQLIEEVGYPYRADLPPEFRHLANGDWIGEIYWMLYPWTGTPALAHSPEGRGKGKTSPNPYFREAGR